MNAHVNIAEAVSQVADQTYRFEIGQTVEHENGGMRSIIFDREKSACGRELYHVYVVPEDAYGRPIRIILGDALRARTTSLVAGLFEEYRIYRAFVADADTEMSEEVVEHFCKCFFDAEANLVNAPASLYADLLMKVEVFKEIVSAPGIEEDFSDYRYVEALGSTMNEIETMLSSNLH